MLKYLRLSAFSELSVDYVKSLKAAGLKVLLSIGGASISILTSVDFMQVLKLALSTKVFEDIFISSFKKIGSTIWIWWRLSLLSELIDRIIKKYNCNHIKLIHKGFDQFNKKILKQMCSEHCLKITRSKDELIKQLITYYKKKINYKIE